MLLVVWPLQSSPARRIPALLAQSGASPRPGLCEALPLSFLSGALLSVQTVFPLTSLLLPMRTSRTQSTAHMWQPVCVQPAAHTLADRVSSSHHASTERRTEETYPSPTGPYPTQPPLAPLAVTHGGGHQLSVAKSPWPCTLTCTTSQHHPWITMETRRQEQLQRPLQCLLTWHWTPLHLLTPPTRATLALPCS